MSETLKRVQARAREIAQSGKFNGWRAVAFELQFEPGFFDAYEWIYSPSTKEELEVSAGKQGRGALMLTTPILPNPLAITYLTDAEAFWDDVYYATRRPLTRWVEKRAEPRATAVSKLVGRGAKRSGSIKEHSCALRRRARQSLSTALRPACRCRPKPE